MSDAASRMPLGIIGAGRIVESSHLPVLLNLPSVRVAWVTDQSPARSRLLEEMFGVPCLPIADLPSALDGVATCFVATPVGVRRKYVEACAERGIAVMTEKPFATSEAMHRELCALFPAHKLGASFQRRFYAGIRALNQLIEHAVFGDLRAVKLSVGGFDLKSGGPTSYLADARLAGGGAVMDLGVHGLDQVLVASAATDVRMHRVTSTALDGVDYDVHLEGELETPRGVVQVQGDFSRLRPLVQGTIFTFEHARVSLGPTPDSDLVIQSIDRGTELDVPLRREGARTVNQAFFELWRTFIDGLKTERPSWASATTSVLTSRWVDAVYERIPS